jgi:PPK2 family polyphosphate:nucleotide phosphotransferase
MLDRIRIDPGTKPDIAGRDAADRLGLDSKKHARERLDTLRARLEKLQGRLYAESRHSVLLVLQGLDASGKDGVIRTVFEGVNPQSCTVAAFKAPTATELAHDYLWRISAALPPRGEIGIFNRSHYEDVVAVRMLALAPEKIWKRRPGHIVEWERMLVDEGTSVIKVFLNVSKKEQQTRLQERIDDPEKRWKFRKADLDVRARFDDYIAAYDDVIEQTSSSHAPWYIVPADHNWVKATAVAELLVDALERIDPQLPKPEDGLDGLVIV